VSQASRYHPALVALHWLLAVLIVAALALGALVMARMSNSDPMKIEALRSHMTGAALILALMLARLALRAGTAHPPPATAGHAWLDRLAWGSHRLLYVLVFAQVASGVALALDAGLPEIVFAGRGALPDDFWAFTPRAFHYAFSRALMALIGLHVAAALYHALIRRDGLLRRMGFGRRFAAREDATAQRLDPQLSEIRR